MLGSCFRSWLVFKPTNFKIGIFIIPNVTIWLVFTSQIAHTHTHTHARTHTHTHIHRPTCICMHACTHIYVHTHTHTYTHTHTQTHTHIHAKCFWGRQQSIFLIFRYFILMHLVAVVYNHDRWHGLDQIAIWTTSKIVISLSTMIAF